MDWHQRYLQQARWTRELRTYLFDKAGLRHASKVLEAGCGTGAILSELPPYLSSHGLDLDGLALAQCHMHAPDASLVQGNALQLPYISRRFDIVYCHFLLLWVKDPLQALIEMKRVARPGGYVIAFAEPDYTRRVDQPRELISLGKWQTESLQRQGAHPSLGARLADLFFRARIQLVETGPIQTAESNLSPEDWEMEWAVIESDLAGYVPSQDIQKMKRLDREARARGERVLSIPTFFALGQS